MKNRSKKSPKLYVTLLISQCLEADLEDSDGIDVSENYVWSARLCDEPEVDINSAPSVDIPDPGQCIAQPTDLFWTVPVLISNVKLCTEGLLIIHTAGSTTPHPTIAGPGPFGSGPGVIRNAMGKNICFNTGHMYAPYDYCFTSRVVKGDREATANYRLSISVQNPPKLSIT